MSGIKISMNGGENTADILKISGMVGVVLNTLGQRGKIFPPEKRGDKRRKDCVKL